jgi:hypothetical protein
MYIIPLTVSQYLKMNKKLKCKHTYVQTNAFVNTEYKLMVKLNIIASYQLSFQFLLCFNTL